MSSGQIRVKMCGMTRATDVRYAVSLGVNAIGMIFYPQSPRCITVEQAKLLIHELPKHIQSVAVLVNPQKAEVESIIKALPIQLLQFHGEEPREFCEQFNMPYIKAIQPHSSLHIFQCAITYSTASALLIDTPSTLLKGGTGNVFDWTLIPDDLNKPYFLAGGLNEGNILQALRSCKPYAVDVNSGIETSPGIKDHDKMSRLMQKLGEYNE